MQSAGSVYTGIASHVLSSFILNPNVSISLTLYIEASKGYTPEGTTNGEKISAYEIRNLLLRLGPCEGPNSQTGGLS
jgi:hypothetical protein